MTPERVAELLAKIPKLEPAAEARSFLANLRGEQMDAEVFKALMARIEVLTKREAQFRRNGR